MTASIDKGGIVAVVVAVITGESWVAKPKELDLGWLFDKWASLNAPNKVTKSLVVSPNYVGKAKGPPLRVPMKAKS